MSQMQEQTTAAALPYPAFPGQDFSGVRLMKEAAKAIFSLGDYRKVAETLDDAARSTVEAAAILPGQRVLDVAAGNGNAAIWAAKAGAEVVALDLTPAMLEWGKARSASEKLPIQWVQGDAEELPFDNERFDCVLSVFGASLAPRPQTAASELFRVVHSGGIVAIANWTHDCFPSHLGDVLSSHLGTPAPRLMPQAVWTHEDKLRSLFASWTSDMRLEHRTLHLKNRTFDDFRHFGENNMGFLVAARRRLPPEAYEKMMEDVRNVASRFNVSPNGDFWLDHDYLIAVAVKASLLSAPEKAEQAVQAAI